MSNNDKVFLREKLDSTAEANFKAQFPAATTIKLPPPRRKPLWEHPLLLVMITGFFTICTTFMASYFASKQARHKQHWVRVDKVELLEKNIEKLRLTIEINGRAYSFPTKTLFATASQASSFEASALASGSRQYNIRVEVIGMDHTGKVYRLITPIATISSGDVPTSDELTAVSRENGRPFSRITFKISDKP